MFVLGRCGFSPNPIKCLDFSFLLSTNHPPGGEVQGGFMNVSELFVYTIFRWINISSWFSNQILINLNSNHPSTSQYKPFTNHIFVPKKTLPNYVTMKLDISFLAETFNIVKCFLWVHSIWSFIKVLHLRKTMTDKSFRNRNDEILNLKMIIVEISNECITL